MSTNKISRHPIIFLTGLVLVLAQCKSVDITVLGYFNKKISVNRSKDADKVSEGNTKNKKNRTIVLSGKIMDSLNHNPIKDADVYLIKNKIILRREISSQDGTYAFTDISPDSFTVHLNITKTKTQIRRNVYLNSEIDTTVLNFFIIQQ